MQELAVLLYMWEEAGMKKIKIVQIWSDVNISQEWDRDTGYEGVSGSTTFYALFEDGIIRYRDDGEWVASKIPSFIEVEEK